MNKNEVCRFSVGRLKMGPSCKSSKHQFLDNGKWYSHRKCINKNCIFKKTTGTVTLTWDIIVHSPVTREV